jgi:hypothetical protein
MAKKTENFIIIALTMLLIGVFGFNFFEINRVKDYADNFAILQNQLSVMGQIEGKNIFHLLADADKAYLEKSLNINPINRTKFVIVLNDSSCHPCFPSYISGYISDLREHGIEIDPTQWCGIFTGKAKNEVEMMFKSVFGPKAKIFYVNQLNPVINPHDDAYILFLTESNAIFAASRVFKVNTEIKQYFGSRVVNYFHSKILTTNYSAVYRE